MDTMINEDGLTLKAVEVYFLKKICETGQKMTREFLEGYDRYLMGTRDRAAYRHKGYRKTSIKTVYGEVEYRQSVYEVTREDGTHEYVFLLAEVLSAAKVKVKDCEGHGYEYPVRGRIVSLGGPVRGAGSLMPAMAGYRQ